MHAHVTEISQPLWRLVSSRKQLSSCSFKCTKLDSSLHSLYLVDLNLWWPILFFRSLAIYPSETSEMGSLKGCSVFEWIRILARHTRNKGMRNSTVVGTRYKSLMPLRFRAMAHLLYLLSIPTTLNIIRHLKHKFKLPRKSLWPSNWPPQLNGSSPYLPIYSSGLIYWLDIIASIMPRWLSKQPSKWAWGDVCSMWFSNQKTKAKPNT